MCGHKKSWCQDANVEKAYQPDQVKEQDAHHPARSSPYSGAHASAGSQDCGCQKPGGNDSSACETNVVAEPAGMDQGCEFTLTVHSQQVQYVRDGAGCDDIQGSQLMNPCGAPVHETRNDGKDARGTGDSSPNMRRPLRVRDPWLHGLTPGPSLLMEPAQINCDGPAKEHQQQPGREQRHFD